MANVYLLTGDPGTGKTTVIRQALAKSEDNAGGFYTEEIKSGRTRQGFRIITLDGQSAILAHVDISSPLKVSRYGVDIHTLDKVGTAAIHQAIKENSLIVIDEIGKMELLSPLFREATLKAIDSGKKVLGTIMLSPNSFADQIKRHDQVKVIQISRTNHDQVLKDIVRWLESITNENNPYANWRHR